MKKLLDLILILIFISGCVSDTNQTNIVEKVPATGEEWFHKARVEPDTQLQIMYYTNAINYGPDQFPNYCAAINNRASAKKNMKDVRGALEDYNLCIDLCPELIISYGFRGECKMQLNDLVGAVEDFEIVIKSNVLDLYKADAYYNIGICLYNLNEKDSACQAWSDAGQLGSVAAYDLIKEYCQ